MRIFYLIGGILALGLGIVGAFVPLLPTVPFVLLAAFCFARSNPAWEQRILDHPTFGPHVKAWRQDGAISLYGKVAAIGSLIVSAGLGLWMLDGHWRYIPPAVALCTGTFILMRPTK